MAVTNTLLRTVEVTHNFLKNAPLTGIGGNPTEPAFTLGDMTRQFILQAPFAWRWNRTSTTFKTSANVQDYVKSIPNFGWLESITYNDGNNTSQSISTVENRLNLPEDNSPSSPRYASARLDDDAGNITFRVLPIPDAIYTMTVTYQNSSPIFTTLTDTWTPLPDYMANIYNLGFRAFAYEYFDDPRFGFAYQVFLRQLVSASEGLSETSKNVFLQEFVNFGIQQQTTQTGSLGRQGRSGY